tara:strand:+ start:180 stop:623 length:444 start_codon:yes stop_codon:yes gene_type:complete
MNRDRLLKSVKEHEGYRTKVYLDTLGKRTVGYGHLCVEDHWEDDKEYEWGYLEEILHKDLREAIAGADELIEQHNCKDLEGQAKEVVVEMIFQLGKTGVSKFKKMWEALSEYNYIGASFEMLDSKWANQTPNRAKKMAALMKSCSPS